MFKVGIEGQKIVNYFLCSADYKLRNADQLNIQYNGGHMQLFQVIDSNSNRIIKLVDMLLMVDNK